MAIGVTKAHTRIEKNRQWEDYQSLKRYWSHKGRPMTEVIFDGAQTSTNAAAEFVSGHGETIAFNGATTHVYIATEADDATQDGKSVWIDYTTSVGVLYEAVETKLDTATSTATEVPIGCMGTPYIEAVASVAGETITMTAIVGHYVDEYKGWYVVACGDATDQMGASLIVLSSSNTTPVVLTCTTTPNANWAADNVSLQKTLHADVYRIRRMYCEQETLDTKEIQVVDFNNGNTYGVIAQANTYGNAGSRYFALDSDYRCFLGRLQIRYPFLFDVDADDIGFQVGITFTPKSETVQTAADITLTFDFTGKLDWQPCIELEPATEVTITIKNLQNVLHGEVLVSFTCLEITV